MTDNAKPTPDKVLSIPLFTFDKLSDDAKEKARQWYKDSMDSDEYGVKDSIENVLSEFGASDLKVYWSLSHCQGDGVAFEGQLTLEEVATAFRELRRVEQAGKRQKALSIHNENRLDGDVKEGSKVRISYRSLADDSTKKMYEHVVADERGDWTVVSLKRTKGSYNGVNIDIVLEKPESESFHEWLKAAKPDTQFRDRLIAFHEANVSGLFSIKHRGHYYHWNSMEVEVSFDHDDETTVPNFESECNYLENAFDDWLKDLSRFCERLGYDCIEGATSDESVDENIRINDYLFDEDGEFHGHK